MRECVWITGAGSGIGAAMARTFAGAGYRVALTGRSVDRLAALCDEIGGDEGRVRIFPADVTDRARILAMGEDIVHWAGRVDVLCNNAGLNVPLRRWDQLDWDSWDRVIATNLTGALNVIAAALGPMRRQKSGVMIHTSSWAGRFHADAAGVPYGASKHALTDLSASLNAQEGPNGIRSTALCPGEVATPLLNKRPGFDPARAAQVIQPEDVAGLALHVARMNPNVAVHEITVAPVIRTPPQP
ncbi:SDR family oxidoreductase [Rhodovulum euryhalinum]|uniref:NADP-dependent 3-hydroxy acid dehydrogenase YdfG n=1 Tax=Rhodovulum euryhalinum TaxID=35805 RepID=A0A4R2KHU9_9RHOB|nr:SDR family oxidoreductase [Rhodovulum euryhalinum]TCO70089.1 NADP-dependent 3-hydroxy acid dehydrogenase YdfG [Rhodovulum euryhalinum]